MRKGETSKVIVLNGHMVVVPDGDTPSRLFARYSGIVDDDRPNSRFLVESEICAVICAKWFSDDSIRFVYLQNLDLTPIRFEPHL